MEGPAALIARRSRGVMHAMIAAPANSSDAHDSTLGDDAVKHLAELMRIDTTNPPGNETPAAEYLAGLLSAGGLEPTLLGAVPERQNVVTRLKGSGEKSPLLLHAHTDVVPAEPESWSHGPFSGDIADGYLWGRGAIDMKHMAIMSALVIRKLKAEKVPLKRDVIFAGVADEEAGCDFGSKWLADNHAELFRAEYALGEAGGFTVYLNGAVLYPLGTAERGTVWMKLRMKGPPGHGSIHRTDNVLGRLGRAVAKLVSTRLPQHRTKVVDRYVQTLASTQKFPRNVMLRNLHVRKIADLVISTLPDQGMKGATTGMLSNTAVPTVLRAGSKVNVVPGIAEVEIDGRTLPTQTSTDLIAEIKKVIEDDCEIEIMRDMPPIESDPDTDLMRLLDESVRRAHPGSVPVPFLMPGFTDAKNWSRLGTKCYGFIPVRFPDDGVKFGDLFHGHNERIPVEGLKWGVNLLYQVVRDFATR
jgi:acetylornithine deacetylase/succinyl-diaminopimelate desuccinylase-like protein